MFPVVIPFLFIGEVRPALRLSNAVGHRHDIFLRLRVRAVHRMRAWPTRLVMVAIGCAMVGVAIALGGELGWSHAWSSMMSGASNRE
jgi:hypothetical protein